MSIAYSELLTFLNTVGSLGIITIGNMPATPNAIGTLYEYPGRPPERRFGISGVGYEHRSYQLMFRGEPFDYEAPTAKAEAAYRALTTIQVTSLSGTMYYQIDPQQSPGRILPIDELNRHKIGFNFYAFKDPS